jgi:hypothetical protein
MVTRRIKWRELYMIIKSFNGIKISVAGSQPLKLAGKKSLKMAGN